MNSIARRFRAALAGFAVLLGAMHPAAAQDIALVGTGAAPAEFSINLPAAGDYELRLNDLLFPDAMGLASLDALVSNAGGVVGVASLGSPLGFTADAGAISVQVVGQTATLAVGLYGLEVVDATGAVVAAFVGQIAEAAVPSSVTEFIEQFVVVDDGTYTFEIGDLGFPADFADLRLQIISQADNAAVGELSAASPSITADLTAGTYDLAVVAVPASPDELGVFSISADGGPDDSNLFSRTFPIVSDLAERTFVTETVTVSDDGIYTLALTDLGFPAAFETLQAILLGGGSEIARVDGDGSTSFNASAGTYQLLIVASPDAASGAGSFQAGVAGGPFDEPIFDLVESVDTPTGADGGDTAQLEISIVAPGTYTLELVDFAFPTSLDDLQLLLLDGSTLLGTLTGPGSFNFDVAAPGVLTAAVVGTGAEGGLIGVTVTDAGGSAVFEQTQALGTLFFSESFEVAEDGTLTVELTDLGFPADFLDLRAAVTRGSETVGFILSGGSFDFEATAGTYSLNVLATADPTAGYGAFETSIQASAAPPPPEPPPPAPAPVPAPVTEGGGGGGTIGLGLFGLLLLAVCRRGRRA